MWSSFVILGVLSVLISYTSGFKLGREIFFFTLPVILLYTVFVFCNLTLIRRPGRELVKYFPLANVVTAVRIFLVAPTLVLLFRGYYVLGTVLYSLGAISDAVDGYVARRFRQETVLGIILDPVGDIFITFALFYFFWVKGDIPLWLFIVLIIRYTQFFVGWVVLGMLGALPDLRATVAGKVVGVMQAIGIIMLLARKVLPFSWPPAAIDAYLFAILGAAFVSVIVSQTVIGWKALKNII